MLKFSANISWLYREWPFLDRPEKAAQDGFAGVECLFPYEFEPEALASALKRSDLPLVLLNAPAGSWNLGDRGLAGLPQRYVEFAESLQTALRYARALDCPKVHVMAGNHDPSIGIVQQNDCLVERLQLACDQASAMNVTILIEPLNTFDMPDYLIPDLTSALLIHERVNRSNLKIQLDLYHQQMTGGDLTRTLLALGPNLGHVQCAGVPGRHEPDSGEVNYSYIFQQLTKLNHRVWVGAEYTPMNKTRDCLGWLSRAQNMLPANNAVVRKQ